MATSELSLSDEWQTPPWLVEQMALLFGPFTLDAAAARWNHQAPRYLTERDDALGRAWRGRVWLNPPYSRGNLIAFMRHAKRQVLAGHADLVAGVVPHSTADKWWRHVAEPVGRVLSSESRWGALPFPLEDWRVTRSEGVTTHVIPVMRRVAFLHRDGKRKQTVGWNSNARGSHAAFCFSSPDVRTNHPLDLERPR